MVTRHNMLTYSRDTRFPGAEFEFTMNTSKLAKYRPDCQLNLLFSCCLWPPIGLTCNHALFHDLQTGFGMLPLLSELHCHSCPGRFARAPNGRRRQQMARFAHRRTAGPSGL